VERVESVETVKQAMNRLSAEHSHILALRYTLDLSYAEIAEVVGAPESTVTMRLYHAKRALRSVLRDQGRARMPHPELWPLIDAYVDDQLPAEDLPAWIAICRIVRTAKSAWPEHVGKSRCSALPWSPGLLPPPSWRQYKLGSMPSQVEPVTHW
jgi:hypothetical protein